MENWISILLSIISNLSLISFTFFSSSALDMAKFVVGCLASLVTLADCLPGEAKVELAKAYKDAKGTLPGAQTGSGVTAAIQKHVLQAGAAAGGGVVA